MKCENFIQNLLHFPRMGCESSTTKSIRKCKRSFYKVASNSESNSSSSEEVISDLSGLEGISIEGYEYICPIGEGGNSRVVKVQKDGEEFAVKVIELNDPNLNLVEQNTKDAKCEADMMMLFNHPNVIKVFDIVQDQVNNNLYIVMELCKGNMLEIQTEDIRLSFAQALSAVEYLHFQRIAHRDIKPANLLVHKDGNICLADFGCSIFLPEGNNYIQCGFIGTTAFFPPEIFSENTYNPFFADIWALGVTLYQIIFKKLPFYAPKFVDLAKKIRYTDPEFPEDANPMVVDLISKMLKKYPHERITFYEIWRHPWLRCVLHVIKPNNHKKLIYKKLGSLSRTSSIRRITTISLPDFTRIH